MVINLKAGELMPERPTNVVLIRANGEKIPLELVYTGKDENSCDVWEAYTSFSPEDELFIGVLPGFSVIVLKVKE